MGKYINQRQFLQKDIQKSIRVVERTSKNSATGPYDFGSEQGRLTSLYNLEIALSQAQTIIFPAAQIKVFMEIGKTYTEKLEYQLPYPHVLIQLTEPILFDPLDAEPIYLEAIVLTQMDMQKIGGKNLTFFGQINGVETALGLDEMKEPVFMNKASFISRRNTLGGPILMNIDWTSGLFDSMSSDKAVENVFKPLAIACIGYINCENVYLEKEGEVEEKINRKREREGKKMLEPYYVCRIRGVKYDSEGRETIRDASGRHVSFRFDVRGHFRRYESGKTTWVRPHQRGLDKELYIPKTYIVPDPPEEKEHKP